jgi:hypothetical protein
MIVLVLKINAWGRLTISSGHPRLASKTPPAPTEQPKRDEGLTRWYRQTYGGMRP